MILAIVFIINKIISYEIDFTAIFTLNVLLMFIFCALFQGVNTFFASFVYNNLLKIVCKTKLNQKAVSLTYCKTSLFKYLPGNVMHFIGRNQIAVDCNQSHVDVALATVIETLCFIIGATIITAVCVFNYLINYIQMLELDFLFILLIGLAGMAVLALVAFVFRKKLSKLIAKYKFLMQKENVLSISMVVFKCMSRLLVNALSFVLLMFAFGLVPDSFELLILVIGFFVMSWLIGYVTPGAPGGIGVREFIMTVFLGSYFPESTLLTVVILFRVLCIVADVISYLSSLVYAKFYKEKSSES